MKYLTAEELKAAHRDEARGILARPEFSGKSVRDRFAVRVFNRYHDRFFPDRNRTAILDFGAASGAFAAELTDAGYREFSGADLDDYRPPERREFYRDFRTLDFSNDRLPWPDGSFDAVVAWCVLPHLENPFHAIREIARVLRPGGLFIFTAPYLGARHARRYFARHGDFRSYRATNNHLVLFTSGVIQKAVLRYFDLLATEYSVRPKILSGSPRALLRRFVYRFAPQHLRRVLARRWAYDAAYVLRRK